MPALQIGIDLVQVDKIRRLALEHASFLERIFTPKEIEYCMKKRNKYQHFAARFAVKEAVFKALGTGWMGKMQWREIEVLNDGRGKPFVNLHGYVKKIARSKGINNILVSLTHCQEYAVAQVVMQA